MVLRILHSKTFLTAGVIIVTLGVSTLLLAENSGDDMNDSAGAAIRTAITDAMPASSTTSTVVVPNANAPASPGVSAAAGASGPLSNGVSPAPGRAVAPAPVPPAPPAADIPPLTVLSGSASPDPVYESTDVTYTATISGSASSVTFKLVPNEKSMSAIYVALARVSSGGGQETWTAVSKTGHYTAAKYELTILASGPQGQQDNRPAGTLTVLAGIG